MELSNMTPFQQQQKQIRERITQRKEDGHFETTVWDDREMGGWYPVLTGYGHTQEEADTKLLTLLVDDKPKKK